MEVDFNSLPIDFVAESIKNLLIEGGLTLDNYLANSFQAIFLGRIPENASRREKELVRNILECLKKMNYKPTQELITLVASKIRTGPGVEIQRIVRQGVRQQRSGEDIPVVIKGQRYEVYGIIDGHGASEYTHDKRFSEALYRLITDHFQTLGSENMSLRELENWLVLWDDMLKPYWKAQPGEYQGGASVSLAIYDKKIKKLYVATVGDSPLVVLKGRRILYSSRPHDAKRRGEADLIRAKGGQIVRGKVVVGNDVLAMTRSLGDYELKPPIIPHPDVEEFNVTKGVGLVIGSDGMFEDLDRIDIEKRSVGILEDLLSLGIRKIIDKYARRTDDDCSLVVVKFV